MSSFGSVLQGGEGGVIVMAAHVMRGCTVNREGGHSTEVLLRRRTLLIPHREMCMLVNKSVHVMEECASACCEWAQF